MEYLEAIKHALSGGGVVFLGAGFSLKAKDSKGADFMNSESLAEHLCQLADIEKTKNLGDATEYYLEDNSVEELIPILQTTFRASEIQEQHKVITSINWKRLYTTNYDDIAEKAYAANGKPYTSIIVDDPIRKININSNLIVHINGFVDRLNNESIYNEFKIANTSYLTESFTKSEWYALFVDDLTLAKVVFFVGYSLYDLDIQRVLHRHKETSNKCFFIVGKEPEKKIEIKLNKFKTIVPVDSSDFANDIFEAKKHYKPSVEPHVFSSFEQYDLDYFNTGIDEESDEDVFRLLFLGALNNGRLLKAVTTVDKNNFYLFRDKYESTVQDIESGAVKNIIVESDLGNGKTLFIEGIKCFCATKGIPCFELLSERIEVEEELDLICACPGKQVIIIENYHNHENLLKKVSLKRPDELVLILTGRTAINDVYYEKLDDIFKTEFRNVDLNILSDNEIDKLINLLERYGLWGKFTRFSRHAKQKKIKTLWRASFSNILLAVIDSADILKRLGNVIGALEERRPYHDVVAAICIFHIINVKVHLGQVLDALDKNILNTIVFKTNKAVKELVDIESYYISAKSSILAKYITNHILDAEYLTRLLVDIYANASKYARGGNLFKTIVKELGKFSSVQEVLPESKRRPMTSKYFDTIKVYNNNIDNPHFWLQYAISQVVFENFERAKMYFDSAYSLAEKKENFYTDHLDNHYARFLLLRACNNSNYLDYQYFINANTIIQRQIHNTDTRHFPFRVARHYLDYYKRYFSKLSDENKEHFVNQCKIVLKRIDGITGGIKSHFNVRECRDCMALIISGG